MLEKNKPHWLKEALKGKLLKLEGGGEAYVRYLEDELNIDQPLIGVVICDKGRHALGSWTISGKWYSENEYSRYDIVGLWDDCGVEFNHWSILNDEWVALAKDSRDRWWVYNTKDLKMDVADSWFIGAGSYSYICLSRLMVESMLPKCDDWTKSMIIRPEGM